MQLDDNLDVLTQTEAAAELERSAALLRDANLAYHQADAPIMSDAEFDAIRRRNAALEARFPDLVRQDSPSATLGAPAAEGFCKITHAQRMLSLGNAFTDEDVEDFVKRIRKYLGLTADTPIWFTSEPKIDGLSLSLRYEHGKLIQAATRGDGAIGENVTQNAKTIEDIPHVLPASAPEILEVRGEVYMSHQDFSALNQRQEAAGAKTFANPSNAVSYTHLTLPTKA